MRTRTGFSYPHLDAFRRITGKQRCDSINESNCKRLNGLGLNSLVLSKASRKMFAIKASNWSDSAHRFLKLGAESGNVEASYTLGMIFGMAEKEMECRVELFNNAIADKSVKGAGLWIDPKISDFQMNYPRFKKED